MPPSDKPLVTIFVEKSAHAELLKLAEETHQSPAQLAAIVFHSTFARILLEMRTMDAGQKFAYLQALQGRSPGLGRSEDAHIGEEE